VRNNRNALARRLCGSDTTRILDCTNDAFDIYNRKLGFFLYVKVTDTAWDGEATHSVCPTGSLSETHAAEMAGTRG
jgi:hypothetical protein